MSDAECSMLVLRNIHICISDDGHEVISGSSISLQVTELNRGFEIKHTNLIFALNHCSTFISAHAICAICEYYITCLILEVTTLFVLSVSRCDTFLCNLSNVALHWTLLSIGLSPWAIRHSKKFQLSQRNRATITIINNFMAPKP